ncbi:MAG: hypothetical protein QHJ73_10195 [Armatimonadota bacterium]|nr:hypothetical protein [Armatimonadota bacterium]
MRWCVRGWWVLIAVTGVLLGRNTASGAPVLLPDECPAAYSLRGSVRGLSGGARATLFCHFRDLANTLVLHFSVDEAIIERRTSGRSVRLAAARLPRVRGGVLDFTLKRRPWRISLIVAGETLAEAFDSELSGGYAGYQTTGGAQVELHLQTVEPVYFTDDFARSPGEAGAWQPLSGEWRVSAVEAGRHGNQVARYSSNAFSLAGSASATALITTGYWFWDDYLAEVSVKPEERGAVGLAVFLQDAQNYLLFRWSAADPGRPGSGQREILRVVDGRRTVLGAAPGGYQPRQWYRLGFSAVGSVLTAFIDGQAVCRVASAAFGQGRVGLYVEQCARAVFDDARVTAADAYQSDFRRNAANEWVDCAGTWTTDRKTRCRQAVGNGENLTVTGGPHWKEYVFGADVFPGSGGAVGLAAACRGPGEYLLFRVPTDGKGVACLLEVRGKEQAVLAEALSPVAVRPGARLKLAVTGETLTGYVENRPVVAAPQSRPSVASAR